ncbi:MAG TPA: GNAT family N-acetyltransferase [Trueperaceae bacterium]|nr:GNAT family N-acetyltransferase [Trueperaceae bacterium]
MPAAAVLPGKPGTDRPAVRLREAELSDAGSLSELYTAVAASAAATRGSSEDESGSLHTAPTQAQMRAWLTSCGVLLVEDAAGKPMAAVRYKNSHDGWEVDRIATLPSERGQGYGRWLMTKLEALAIRGNVKRLTLEVQEPSLLPYYRRMGYRTDADDPLRLSKRVGGVWQRQEVTR